MKTEDCKKLETQLKKFWRPGDEIICTRIFRRSNNKCYLCGNTPIEWHHVLLNSISNQTIDVEFSCVINMKKILEESGSDQKILFFPKHSAEAIHINKLYHGTADILEFNNNIDVIIKMLSRPQDLSYRQVKAIIDHTGKFPDGLERELFRLAVEIYAERRYFIYDGLAEHEKSGNVERSIADYFQREWEDVQAAEEEYQRARYNTCTSDDDEGDCF